MKRLLILALTVLIGGSVAAAQTTTAPSPTVARVLVVPFKLVGDTSSHSWVGAALQENLVSAVASDPQVQPLALSQPMSNSDSASAIAAAKEAGASTVIFGSYQFSDNQLRVTGQVMDVAAGRTLATLTATGPVPDLFKIEDSLASQLNSTLPQAPSNMPVVSYGPDQSTAPPSDVAVSAPQSPDAYAAPAPVAAQYSYNPYYAYSPYTAYSPYYSYGYPTYCYPQSPVFIYGGFGFGRFNNHFHTFPRGGVSIHFGAGAGFGGGHMGHR